MKQQWRIIVLDTINYSSAMEIMNNTIKFIISNKEKNNQNVLFLLQHEPVITLGKRAKKENLLLPLNYKQRFPELEITETDRGGDVTFHGPGQLVGYFSAKVLSLGKNVADMVRNVSQLIIDLLQEYGLQGFFNDELPGIWIESTWGVKKQRKIASIGMKIVDKQFVKHGFALNINNDLNYFNLINPCGLPSDIMTSMEKEGIKTNVEEVTDTLIKIFSENREVEILEKQDFLQLIGEPNE